MSNELSIVAQAKATVLATTDEGAKKRYTIFRAFNSTLTKTCSGFSGLRPQSPAGANTGPDWVTEQRVVLVAEVSNTSENHC